MTMEKQVYGMKPSYKIMKSLIKKYCEKGSYYSHCANLVYYTIKHNFNEEQVIDYFNNEIHKCEKMLKHHSHGVYFKIPYELMKDVLNISLDDFALQEFRHFNYNYDWEHRLWNYDISKIIVSFSYRFYHPDYKKKPLFRDYNDHTVYLFDKMMHRGYFDSRIDFMKNYDKEGNNDEVTVIYRQSYNAAGNNASEITLNRCKKEFIDICLGLWHFIKLLDCSENPNDIDISYINSRKDKVAQLYDHTKNEMITYKWEQERKKKLNIE